MKIRSPKIRLALIAVFILGLLWIFYWLSSSLMPSKKSFNLLDVQGTRINEPVLGQTSKEKLPDLEVLRASQIHHDRVMDRADQSVIKHPDEANVILNGGEVPFIQNDAFPASISRKSIFAGGGDGQLKEQQAQEMFDSIKKREEKVQSVDSGSKSGNQVGRCNKG